MFSYIDPIRINPSYMDLMGLGASRKLVSTSFEGTRFLFYTSTMIFKACVQSHPPMAHIAWVFWCPVIIEKNTLVTFYDVGWFIGIM